MTLSLSDFEDSRELKIFWLWPFQTKHMFSRVSFFPSDFCRLHACRFFWLGLDRHGSLWLNSIGSRTTHHEETKTRRAGWQAVVEYFVGTGRPDKIVLRVVKLQRTCFVHQLLYVLNFEFIKVDQCFLLLNTRKPSNPFILRRIGSMETFLPICWRPFIWGYNLPKRCASRLPNILGDLKASSEQGDRFVEKKGGLSRWLERPRTLD